MVHIGPLFAHRCTCDDRFNSICMWWTFLAAFGHRSFLTFFKLLVDLLDTFAGLRGFFVVLVSFFYCPFLKFLCFFAAHAIFRMSGIKAFYKYVIFSFLSITCGHSTISCNQSERSSPVEVGSNLISNLWKTLFIEVFLSSGIFHKFTGIV